MPAPDTIKTMRRADTKAIVVLSSYTGLTMVVIFLFIGVLCDGFGIGM